MPRNHLIAIKPPKLYTTTTKTVHSPKVSIMQGKTRFGPYIFPKIPRNGAVKT